MNALVSLFLASVAHHPVYWALGAYFMFSNLVAALPTPAQSASNGYKFWFAFLHGIAANLPRAFLTMFPALAAKLPFLNGQQNGSQPPADGGK